MTPVWIDSPDAQMTRHFVICGKRLRAFDADPALLYVTPDMPDKFPAIRREQSNVCLVRQTHTNDMWIETICRE